MVSIYLNSPFIKVDLPPLRLAPLYDDFKTSPLSTSLFLQVHGYDYDNAPSTVVSCPQSLRTNLFTRLFTCPQAKLTPHICNKTPTKTL